MVRPWAAHLPQSLETDTSPRQRGSDVRNRNADHKAHDLENPSHFWQRHAASAKKRREKAADDDTNESTVNRSDEKKQEPSFKVIEFSGLFHVRTLMEA
jgi:hypothetical protein